VRIHWPLLQGLPYGGLEVGEIAVVFSSPVIVDEIDDFDAFVEEGGEEFWWLGGEVVVDGDCSLGGAPKDAGGIEVGEWLVR
jgi:hypothetical protein